MVGMRISDAGQSSNAGTSLKNLGSAITSGVSRATNPATSVKKAGNAALSAGNALVSATRSNPSGTGGGSYGSYGGGASGGGSVSTPAATPAPAAPDFDSFLKSYGPYLSQIASFAKSLADYTTSENNQKAQYDAQYNQGLKNLGWDAAQKGWIKDSDPRFLETAFGNSTNSNDNSFAARGLLQSSAFQQAAQNLLDQFNTQKSQADTADQNNATNVNQAISAYNNQYGTKGTQTQQARSNAAQAYASQYGVAVPK